VRRLRIVVLGYLVRGPLGGMAWHHLQYLLGFRALGHDVWFLEHGDEWPSCYDPERQEIVADPSYGLRFAERVLTRLGFGGRWAYHDQRWHGPLGTRAEAVCRSADVVVDVSAVNSARPWLHEPPVRVLVDTDPGFTQVRHLADRDARSRAAAYTRHFTFGELVGRTGCLVPDDGFAWLATRQPVVLDSWPVAPPAREAPFTTVMTWDAYDAVTYDGLRLGMKSDSFAPYLDLPRRIDAPLELAVGSPGAPRAELAARGWRVRDPLASARDPWVYQEFIASSRAEFSVAKHGYVTARTGWFSERSAAYLASGRPVLVQDTGFSDVLPVGEGIVPFTSPDEAVQGAADISRRYERHCRAARRLAEEHFDARAVLGRLLADAGCGP
jgi:hypothetical protein